MGTGASVGHIPEEQYDNLRKITLQSYQDEWKLFQDLNLPKAQPEEWFTKMDTGDILLFKCMQASSKYYKEYQGSQYSHVGIVVKRNGIPYVYESSVKEYIVDVDTNSVQNGIMLSPMKERLYDFYGVVCWRPLTVPDRLEGEFEEVMEKIVEENMNKYYDDADREKLIILFNLQNHENLDRFFCSELVASCYKRLGLLSPDRASNTYIVPDFSSTGYEITEKTKFRQLSPEEGMVHLLRDATLGSEIELVPHWATQDQDYPRITDMLEEDLHIFNGLGITKKDLLSVTDSSLYILLESINGYARDDFGQKVDNFFENLLKPLTSQGLIITARVGQVPFYPTIPYERCEIKLSEGKVSCLPWVCEVDHRHELSRLKIWISIQEEDLFSKGEYMGAICLDPHTLPVFDRVSKSSQLQVVSDDNESEFRKPSLPSQTHEVDQAEANFAAYDGNFTREYILQNIPSRKYPTQAGYWQMRCWIEK